eukprot:5358330-Prymnesium_polylepis.2
MPTAPRVPREAAQPCAGAGSAHARAAAGRQSTSPARRRPLAPDASPLPARAPPGATAGGTCLRGRPYASGRRQSPWRVGAEVT